MVARTSNNPTNQMLTDLFLGPLILSDIEIDMEIVDVLVEIIDLTHEEPEIIDLTGDHIFLYTNNDIDIIDLTN